MSLTLSGADRSGPAQPVRSWFGAPTGPPKIALPPEQRVEIIRHEMRDLPLDVFPVALQPFVVPRESYRQLLTATADMLDLLRRAVLGLAADRAGRMAAIDLDPDQCPLFTADEDFELRHCADMARADVVISADGPKFVEFNVSGAFGGMVHFQQHQRAWQRIRERAGRPAFIGVDAYARLAVLIERTCAELGVPPSVALVGTPREWGPQTPTRNFDLQAAMLRRHGVYAEHLDFEDLLAGIGLPGPLRHPLGLAQFTHEDARVLGYDVSPVEAARDAGFRLIPSQTSRLLHSKKTLALVSEGLPWMTARDRELAARYLPWSRVVGDRKVEWRGDRHDLPRLLVEWQDRFVLKGATGCSGQEVTFGASSSQREWTDLVEDALATGYYIAQEVVESERYPVDVMHSSGDIERISANSVISPFCIGGTPAGCFARFVASERPGIISALTSAMLGCLVAEA